MVTGEAFAEQARSGSYNGISYDRLDCQGFVERVLKDVGIRKPDGSVYNWKGSNSMWRNIPGWRGTVSDALHTFGSIPLGAWVFIIKNDGGEVARGYKDGKGNASHVGIYCNDGHDSVRDSTRSSSRDGVGYRPLGSFTHVLLPDMIVYNKEETSSMSLQEAAHIFRDPNSSDADWINALVILASMMKGV